MAAMAPVEALPRRSSASKATLSELAAGAQVAAKQARERYESSVRELKMALERIKRLKPELDLHEERLNTVECKVKGLKTEIADFITECAERRTASAHALQIASAAATAAKLALPQDIVSDAAPVVSRPSLPPAATAAAFATRASAVVQDGGRDQDATSLRQVSKDRFFPSISGNSDLHNNADARPEEFARQAHDEHHPQKQALLSDVLVVDRPTDTENDGAVRQAPTERQPQQQTSVSSAVVVDPHAEARRSEMVRRASSEGHGQRRTSALSTSALDPNSDARPEVVQQASSQPQPHHRTSVLATSTTEKDESVEFREVVHQASSDRHVQQRTSISSSLGVNEDDARLEKAGSQWSNERPAQPRTSVSSAPGMNGDADARPESDARPTCREQLDQQRTSVLSEPVPDPDAEPRPRDVVRRSSGEAPPQTSVRSTSVCDIGAGTGLEETIPSNESRLPFVSDAQLQLRQGMGTKGQPCTADEPKDVRAVETISLGEIDEDSLQTSAFASSKAETNAPSDTCSVAPVITREHDNDVSCAKQAAFREVRFSLQSSYATPSDAESAGQQPDAMAPDADSCGQRKKPPVRHATGFVRMNVSDDDEEEEDESDTNSGPEIQQRAVRFGERQSVDNVMGDGCLVESLPPANDAARKKPLSRQATGFVRGIVPDDEDDDEDSSETDSGQHCSQRAVRFGERQSVEGALGESNVDESLPVASGGAQRKPPSRQGTGFVRTNVLDDEDDDEESSETDSGQQSSPRIGQTGARQSVEGGVGEASVGEPLPVASGSAPRTPFPGQATGSAWAEVQEAGDEDERSTDTDSGQEASLPIFEEKASKDPSAETRPQSLRFPEQEFLDVAPAEERRTSVLTDADPCGSGSEVCDISAERRPSVLHDAESCGSGSEVCDISAERRLSALHDADPHGSGSEVCDISAGRRMSDADPCESGSEICDISADRRLSDLTDAPIFGAEAVATARASMSSRPSALATGTTIKRRLSWVTDEQQKEQVFQYTVPEVASKVPAHGHWIPDDVKIRRRSFEEATDFAKRLNGRMVSIDYGEGPDDPCECVLVEPMGKILSPADYVTTGFIICALEIEEAEAMQEEWDKTLKITKWLDAGFSIAFPTLLPGAGGERERLEGAVRELRGIVGVNKCILVGKGWGAQLAVEVATRGHVGHYVAGVILVAPGELIEQADSNVDTPTYLVWARDDQVADFCDARGWNEVLRRRWGPPTPFREVSAGGHDIAHMLEYDPSVAQSMLHFTSAVLLTADIFNLIARINEGDEDKVSLPDRTARLCDELPEYLAGLVGGSAGDGEEGSVAKAIAIHAASGPNASQKLRFTAKRLQEWMDVGMRQLASDTE